eukprot:80497-Prorocentrum_minimum.AAC.1
MVNTARPSRTSTCRVNLIATSSFSSTTGLPPLPHRSALHRSCPPSPINNKHAWVPPAGVQRVDAAALDSALRRGAVLFSLVHPQGMRRHAGVGPGRVQDILCRMSLVGVPATDKTRTVQ